MSVSIRFPMTIKLIFTAYIVAVLLLLELMTAVMVVPLVILSAHALYSRPKALCIIGSHKNVCLKAATFAADHLDVAEIHIFEATREEDMVNRVAMYDGDEQMFYELVDEDEEDSSSS